MLSVSGSKNKKMKICGIIAEYNPFHEGHAYQMREARRRSGADALVVMMSGYFVQRGEPAVFDPYVRCDAALKAGADAVFMMPPAASTASAEGFAAYGVDSLYALGCDAISCGLEPCAVHYSDGTCSHDGASRLHATVSSDESSITDITARLSELADKLACEDEQIKETIRNGMKSGLSYPAALAKALGIDRLGPNSLLAVEYLKAIKRGNLAMEFVPVERVGSAYHDDKVIEGIYPSATALRKEILADSLYGMLQKAGDVQHPGTDGLCGALPLGPDDFLTMITDSIRIHRHELEAFADCSPQIAARLRASSLRYKTFEEMATDIKTKDVTYTRIARVLTHILLEIRQADMSPLDPVSYAQIIGFRDAEILSEIKQRCAQKTGSGFHIISKAADHKEELTGAAYAAEIYGQALWNKYHVDSKDFFRQKILKY